MKEQRTRRHETYYMEGGNISMIFILSCLRVTPLSVRLRLLGLACRYGLILFAPHRT